MWLSRPRDCSARHGVHDGQADEFSKDMEECCIPLSLGYVLFMCSTASTAWSGM